MIGCGGRTRTFDSRINNPAPYQLGDATRTEFGCGDESRTRIISFTRRALWSQLSYAAIWWTGRDSNPHKKFAGLLCSRLHHQPLLFTICQLDIFHLPFAGTRYTAAGQTISRFENDQ